MHLFSFCVSIVISKLIEYRMRSLSLKILLYYRVIEGRVTLNDHDVRIGMSDDEPNFYSNHTIISLRAFEIDNGVENSVDSVNFIIIQTRNYCRKKNWTTVSARRDANFCYNYHSIAL